MKQMVYVCIAILACSLVFFIVGLHLRKNVPNPFDLVTETATVTVSDPIKGSNDFLFTTFYKEMYFIPNYWTQDKILNVKTPASDPSIVGSMHARLDVANAFFCKKEGETCLVTANHATVGLESYKTDVQGDVSFLDYQKMVQEGKGDFLKQIKYSDPYLIEMNPPAVDSVLVQGYRISPKEVNTITIKGIAVKMSGKSVWAICSSCKDLGYEVLIAKVDQPYEKFFSSLSGSPAFELPSMKVVGLFTGIIEQDDGKCYAVISIFH